MEAAIFSEDLAGRYWLTRFVILRLLGCIYAVAFFAAATQLLPLMGSNGLTPVGSYLSRVAASQGSVLQGFGRLPSLFWLNHSDLFLVTVAWTGFALSLVVVAGYANMFIMLTLWALYMSIVHVGQEWYGYGWEIQLLETGFLAVFLCPLWDARPFPATAPPIVVIFLFRWLAFRIMLGAGLIKIRGDECWRDLTALNCHFETQPIPNPLSRFFHFLPPWMLKAGVLFNHAVELIIPWFAFWPCWGRRIAGVLMILFQGTLILSGNLSFLNWLTLVPALACLDDGFWAMLLPKRLVEAAAVAAAGAQPCAPITVASWALAVLVGFLSIKPVMNMISTRQIMNTSFNPLNLVNTYGAFGSVGRERYNVVFQGTDAGVPADDAVWRDYEYRALPVAEGKRPRQIAPYQPRLDWQMWFAAMGNPSRYPWTLHLVWKLLHNEAGALSLLGNNPFPEQPPRYVRAMLYRYRFVKGADGRYWSREPMGLWLPPLSIEDPRLLEFLREQGWVAATPSTGAPTEHQ